MGGGSSTQIFEKKIDFHKNPVEVRRFDGMYLSKLKVGVFSHKSTLKMDYLLKF